MKKISIDSDVPVTSKYNIIFDIVTSAASHMSEGTCYKLGDRWLNYVWFT